MFSRSKMISNIANANNSIKYKSFFFAHCSNNFKYYYLSANDPHCSSTFKIKCSWGFVYHKSNLTNTIVAII